MWNSNKWSPDYQNFDEDLQRIVRGRWKWKKIIYVFLTGMDCLVNEIFVILRVFSQSSISSLHPTYAYLKQFCAVF